MSSVWFSPQFWVFQKGKELISLSITGPEGHAMCRVEEVEAEATQRMIVLANQARCPVCVTPITSRSSARVISEARRRGLYTVLWEARSVYCTVD